MYIPDFRAVCKTFHTACFLAALAAVTTFTAQSAEMPIREYVKPQKLYHDTQNSEPGNSLHLPQSAELTARICLRLGAKCSVIYGEEFYQIADATWKYRFIRSHWVKPQDQPEYEIVVSSTGPIYFNCPSGNGWRINIATPICYRDNESEPDCEECKANRPPPAQAPKIGNPIFPSNLTKQEVRTDYQNTKGSLRFVWTYRSDLSKWAHNYEISVSDMNAPNYGNGPEGACFLEPKRYYGQTSPIKPYCYPYAANGTSKDIALRRGNGRVHYFSSGQNFAGAPDVKDQLAPISDGSGTKIGWQVKNGKTNATETYDASGRLIISKELNGQETTFSYSDSTTPPEVAPRVGLLIRVADSFGAALTFSYDLDGRLATMRDPANEQYIYSYDAKGNLASVTYPDNKKISYLYNETGKVTIAAESQLTGIVDENNSRYATYTYSEYKATATEHAGGVNKYMLKESASNWTTVTDPLGTARDYTYYTIISGIKQFTGIYQPAPGGSGVNNTYVYYDANGNVTSFLDFNGKKTVYTYDLTRNLETRRVEASGTALATTISTEWHATLDLPTRIVEPKRLTTNTYDNNGNLLTQTVQATTDTTGATGFGAVVTGLPQTRTYTYNALGQRLTAKGPRTDVNDETTYVYDNAGNLTSITNAAGHVTTLSNYDAHGRAGRITAPNGLHTDFSYTVRGWLSAVSKGSETTSYEYDGIGQLTKATLPDDSSISYTYDAAHRLTGIADNAGNSVAYTLDSIGNRTGEQVKDANGVLVRKISRTYDALNRLKQITGAL